jgi:uncharacterized protein (DUF4415 family)
MKKKTIYKDAPPEVDAAFERSVRIPDFLPSPAELKGEPQKQKVTIMLDKRNIDFFKREAKNNGAHYQTMINNLLRSYVVRHSDAADG